MGVFSNRDTTAPSEIFNRRLWYGVLVFGLMGAARGLDEGLIGTTASLKVFQNKFDLKDPSMTAAEQADLLGNITAMVQVGSIGGALIAFYITDKIGRLWATRQLCLIWITGIAIFLGASRTGSIGMVYAGRFIAGLGIGQTTVVAPSYLAEIAPKAIRGGCVAAFSGCVYLGIMLGYFAVYGSSLHISGTTQFQWVNPNLLHIYFATIVAVLSFFAVESPRWLVKVGRTSDASRNLAKIRNLPEDHWYVQAELLDIQAQLDRQQEATMGTSWLGPIRELVTLKSNRYRLFLAASVQLLGQWSGANSITIYAPEFFAMMGTTGSREKLFATAIFGLVKFCSAIICAVFLVDYLGRKRSLMTGITLQLIAMLYMALFLTIDTTVGDEDSIQSSSQKAAAKGAIGMIYISGFGWAMGWNTVQYLINSEIFPLRLRALGGSIAMVLHFANQYGNSKAVPQMFVALTTAGTMWFFFAVTLIGLGFTWFFIPELSGKSLESVDAVFDLPWYLIGRRGRELTAGQEGVLETYSEKTKNAEVAEHRE